MHMYRFAQSMVFHIKNHFSSYFLFLVQCFCCCGCVSSSKKLNENCSIHTNVLSRCTRTSCSIHKLKCILNMFVVFNVFVMLHPQFRQSEKEREREQNGKNKINVYIKRYITLSQHNRHGHGCWRKLEKAHNNIKSYESDAFTMQDKKREISVCLNKNENGCDEYTHEAWICI